MVRKFTKKIKHNLKVVRYAVTNLRNILRFSKAAPDDSMTKHVPSISVFDAKKKLDKDELLIVDVRSERDFKDAHIEGSIRVDLFSLTDRIPELPRDKTIGVICYGGGASMTVTQMLLDHGFDMTRNIEGGIIRYALDVDEELLAKF